MQQRWTETPSQYFWRRLHHPKPEEPHIRIQVCSSKKLYIPNNCFLLQDQQGKATNARRHQGLHETVDFTLGKYFNRTSYLCLSL